MAQVRQPAALTEGKFSYLAKNDHIVSKKQYAHDAKDEAAAIANTYTQVAYWMNYFSLSRAIWVLDDFTRDHLIYHRDGYLRDGYLQRIYGRIYPGETPHLPKEIGKEITPVTHPQLAMYDDVSGRELIQLTAALEYEFTRGASAYIDPASFEEFVNLHTRKTGEALGTQLRVIAHLYCAASYPATTLTTDVDFVPFLDDSYRPDQATAPGAYKWFDKNGFFWKTLLKEVVGQVQTKLTNIGFYSPEIYLPFRNEDFFAEKKTSVTYDDQGGNIKKIFFIKETAGSNANKIRIHKELTPFICYVAMVSSMREKWIAMTQTVSPMNMGRYKPYSATAKTDFQDAAITPPNMLEFILNPFCKAYITQGMTSTSPFGNLKVDVNDMKEAGTVFYGCDKMIPGTWILQDKNTMKIVKILWQAYTTSLDWCLAIQRGAHLFIKIFISGFTAWYKGIPLAFIPPTEYMYNHFNSLTPA